MALSTGQYTKLHENQSGPGGERPTAFQIIKDNDVIGKLNDKTFLVTGGTDGLGLETVRQLAKTGARVFFTARNPGKAAKVVQALQDEAKADSHLKNARVEWVEIDNNSLNSVKAGAEELLKRSDQLNVLICNAGMSSIARLRARTRGAKQTLGVANRPYFESEDGFEGQFATNHLAHFYLFQLLKPLLLKSSTPSFQSRVVMVSSIAHSFSTVHFDNYKQEKKIEDGFQPLIAMEGDFNPMIAYAQSKTANIWTANEIDRRYGGKGLHGLSLHPGNIQTAGWEGLDQRVVDKMAPFLEMDTFKNGFKSVEQGAATQVLAAIGRDFEGKGGIYLDDCGIAQAAEAGALTAQGYQPYAFSPENESRLWVASMEMLGLREVE